MRLIGVGLLAVSSLSATETAVLVDGTRIVTQGHEDSGNLIRLFTESGVREVPVDTVHRFLDGVVLDEAPWVAVRPEIPEYLLFRPVAPRKPVDPQALMVKAARRHRVPLAVVKSIMAVESGFDPNVRSHRGAVGLMQVKPSTAEQFGLDAHDPEENVDAAARYLRMLLDKYRNYRDQLRRVIAAYNAGPTAVDKYQGVPPFPETQLYVARVLALVQSSNN